MKKAILLSLAAYLFAANITSADTFGTGANQFEIEFVTISGDNGDLGNWQGDSSYTFSGVNHGDYRIGTYEITNEQWDKFTNISGKPNGSEWNSDYGGAYDNGPFWGGDNVPTNQVSWYEAAQFVNWLNTSRGHHAAYKFTGTPGTSNYTYDVWNVTDTGYNAENPYRNSNAYYFLPTKDEWVKAAYWNGTVLQTWATKNDSKPVTGFDSNYDQSYPYSGPWDVGSGSEELNGTYDMMGNVWEWAESPWHTSGYLLDSTRDFCGGSYGFPDFNLMSSYHAGGNPVDESRIDGFRVASVPEPAALSLLAFGGLALLRKRK